MDRARQELGPSEHPAPPQLGGVSVGNPTSSGAGWKKGPSYVKTLT